MAPAPGKCGIHKTNGLDIGYKKCNRYRVGNSPAYCDVSGICRKFPGNKDRTNYNSDHTMCATLEENHQYSQGHLVGIHLYREKDFGGFHQHLRGDQGEYISLSVSKSWVGSFKKDPAADITLVLLNRDCIPLNGIGDISEVPEQNFQNPYGGYHLRGIYFGAVPGGFCKKWVSGPIEGHKDAAKVTW